MSHSSENDKTSSSRCDDSLQPTVDLSPPAASSPDSLTAQLVEVLEQHMADLKAGRAPSRERLLADHPQLASQLDACLAGVEFIHGSHQDDATAPKQLGDFRIRHEVGRGGMGAVYEAEQVSLGRKVALKVLRFGTVADSEAVDRFKREAETVANLHHTNIVPIFSVGSEGGVNYYAMQFIEGPSLDRVAAAHEGALAPSVVANWGLQAAEALTHAHQRDVIHRDVKPSNLLLDGEGRIWLTDFGLAKRLDDVTLSMTGALLGTPRYMSPEQAEATIKVVDHRTDIYSLGATLYELATGQPVFVSDTPHGVINQILHAEPLPPRQHRPDLPRDFETVLLKCLSKEASQRYANAQELAEDLRAIVEDRPIRARRPRVIERTTRWLKKHKNSVMRMSAAVLATLLVVGVIFAGRYVFSRWRLATLTLTTKTPGLVAEVRSGNRAPQMEALPTQQPLEVVSGDVQLHVSGDGQLSQTLSMQLPAGQRKSVELNLNYQRIGRAVPIERSFRLLPFSDGVDPILMSGKEIRRWDPENDTAVWTLDMSQQNGPLVSGERKIRWPWHLNRAVYSTGDKFDQQPFVLGQLEVTDPFDLQRDRDVATTSVDLDQDGEPDVIIASREQAWVLALSGRTGKVLWLATRGGTVDLESPSGLRNRAVRSATLAPPLVAGDLNDDGTADLVVTFGDIDALDLAKVGSDVVPANRWVEAISGRTGETLWRSEVQDKWLDLASNEASEVPYAFRWFVGEQAGSMARGWGVSRRDNPTDIVWRSQEREHKRTGRHSAMPDAPRIISTAMSSDPTAKSPEADDAGERSIVFVAGTRIVQLDPRTGNLQAEPHETGVLTGLPARYADMDGDGAVDVVLCEQRPDKAADAAGLTSMPQYRIAVWSLVRRELLWQRDFTAHWPRKLQQHVAAPRWPVLRDLDGDGACELLIPNGTTSFKVMSAWPKAPYGGLTVIDGRTGEPRWKRELFTLDQQLDHFIVGPDLDSDGVNEVLVTSLWSSQYDLYIDALSGADGHSLWRNKYSLNRSTEDPHEFSISRLTWCGTGNDGWPQLAVSVIQTGIGNRASDVLLFSAGTGQLQHLATGAEVVWTGDVNRDGVSDVCSYVPPKDLVRPRGEINLYQNQVAEYSRNVSDSRFPICDLDGNGVRDMLRSFGRNSIEASSAVSGDVLWTSQLDVAELRRFEVLSQRGDSVAGALTEQEISRRDFDQDGTPDLLIATHMLQSQTFAPLHAISGRTGRPLWKASFQVSVSSGSPMAQFVDLDHDGRAEILYVGAINLDYPQRGGPSSTDVQLWLMVLSAADGQVKWRRPLSPAYGHTPEFNAHRLYLDMLRIESATADLNGDRVLDLIIPAETHPEQPPVADQRVELIAVSGTDGELLWEHELPHVSNTAGRLGSVPPATVVDLEADGTPEVITLEFEDIGDTRRQRLAHVRALEGGTGRLRWAWQQEIASYGEIDDLQEIRARPRPIVLSTNTGRPRIGVVLRSREDANPLEAAVLDHEGQAVCRVPLVAVGGHMGSTHRFYPHDVDGDGDDELIFWNRQAVVATRADSSAAILWRREFPTRLNAQLEGLLPSPTNPTFTVAVLRQGSSDNSLIGVDTKTGDVRWACAGPTARSDGGWIVPERVELLGQIAGAPPIAFYQFENLSICRQAADTRESVDWNFATPIANQTVVTDRSVPELLRTPAVLKPDSEDPRHYRNLPWRFRLSDPDVRQMIRVGKLSALYCFTLILLPGAIVWSLARRRRLDVIAVVATSVGCVSIYLGLTIGDAEGEAHMQLGRIVLALAQLPIIQFVGEPLYWIFRGQWRRVLGWLVASVLISITLAVIVLSYHGSNPGLSLQPSERYSMSGWYLIGIWGAYVTGMLMTVVAVGSLVVSRFRAWRTGRLEKPSLAPIH